VKNGVVILEGEPPLAERAKVWVEPIAREAESRTLAARLKDVIAIARGLPPNLAENHDRSLHGLPKR
jgi:hypothetical protein